MGKHAAGDPDKEGSKDPDAKPVRQGPYIPPNDPSTPGPRFIATDIVADVLRKDGIVMSVDGAWLGHIGHIFVDHSGGLSSWISVEEGKEQFTGALVPLIGAQIEGDNIVVAFKKDIIGDSPQIDVEDHLEASQEKMLIKHYIPGLRHLYGRDAIRTWLESRAGEGGNDLGPTEVVAEALTLDEDS